MTPGEAAVEEMIRDRITEATEMLDALLDASLPLMPTEGDRRALGCVLVDETMAAVAPAHEVRLQLLLDVVQRVLLEKLQGPDHLGELGGTQATRILSDFLFYHARILQAAVRQAEGTA